MGALTPEEMLRMDEPVAQATAPAPALVPRELAVTIDTRDGDGRRRSGVFVIGIPTVNEETRISSLAAQLRRGQPREAFAPDEAAVCDALAYLSVAVRRGTPAAPLVPDWAKDKSLGDVLDVLDVLKLYGEAREHRERFLVARRDLCTGTGGGVPD